MCDVRQARGLAKTLTGNLLIPEVTAYKKKIITVIVVHSKLTVNHSLVNKLLLRQEVGWF